MKKTYSAESTSTRIGVHGGKMNLQNRIFELLKQRGFIIQTDREILERYPAIASTHWEGAKGDLLFKSEIYPAGFCFEFYQEVNTKNRNGGYYDFDKFESMPFLVRCEFIVTRKYISQLIEEEGFENTRTPDFKYAIDKVMHEIKSCWHYKEGKELPEYEFASYNSKDKDGKQLRNGQLKYFRDRKGRLRKGVIYHNINNMWWVVLNKYEFTNEASFYFFDLDTDENRQRKLVKKSGYHKPIARINFDENMTNDISKGCKHIGKQGRLLKANEMLEKLYKYGWTSRHFAFELKANGRLGLLEIESKAWGNHKIHDNPIKLSLYGSTLPMSSSESYWVKSLREYVVHSKRTITEWFCNDRNGEGRDAHYWPEIRKVAWEIGVLAS